MEKKVIFISLLVISILLVLIAGCSENKTAELKAGRYVVPGNELVLSPQVILNENNEYSFIRSPYISFLPTGNYSIEDNKLILHAGESKAYIFTIDGESLIFENDEDLIKKGTLFVFYDDETFSTETKVTHAAD